MDASENDLIVPENSEGKAVDIEHSVTENTTAEAIDLYKIVCERLLNPSLWQQLAGTASASFALWSGDKEMANRPASAGDYLVIDIPGPGPAAGDGYDWVRVETIQKNILPGTEESLAISLRACANPNNAEKGTAHFFKETATSTFIVKRNGNTVTLSYHGRNETPNTTDVPLRDKVRNTLVAIGSLVGLSELQWNSLVKGMLEKQPEES